MAAKPKKLFEAELELLQKLQPSFWRLKTERKRFLKGLAADDKVLKSLVKNGWAEKSGDDWVPTESGYLALMMGEG